MDAGRRVPVFVEDWQIECCGEPPAVGDRVEWSLLFLPDGPERPPSGEESVTLDATAWPYPVERERGGSRRQRAGAGPVLLDAGAVQAFWPEPQRQTGQVRVTGQLLEDHHGSVPEKFPRVAGTVARVRVVTREYVPSPTEARRYLFGDSPPRYREVERSPKHFTMPQLGDGPYWADCGVLVDLVVAGPAGA
jgi:hypothetical protein